jgi:hypothetical protein
MESTPRLPQLSAGSGLDARLHLLDMHRMQTCVKYVPMTPPKPAETLPMTAETNTSHTGNTVKKPYRSTHAPARLHGLHPWLR